MQICTRCDHQNPDTASECANCHGALSEFSATAVALKRVQKNPRVTSVILAVSDDACPACQEAQGTYSKHDAPRLPIPGCSHGLGCRCFYEPVLEEIYP